jgi:hypothetical protein
MLSSFGAWNPSPFTWRSIPFDAKSSTPLLHHLALSTFQPSPQTSSEYVATAKGHLDQNWTNLQSTKRQHNNATIRTNSTAARDETD